MRIFSKDSRKCVLGLEGNPAAGLKIICFQQFKNKLFLKLLITQIIMCLLYIVRCFWIGTGSGETQINCRGSRVEGHRLNKQEKQQNLRTQIER